METQTVIENLPIERANCENVGIHMKPKTEGDEHTEKEIVEMTTKINKYLKNFVSGGCPQCGNELGGILGFFRWGFVSGEGNCASCNWPARGDHKIPGVGRLTNFVLAYHPDCVIEEKETQCLTPK